MRVNSLSTVLILACISLRLANCVLKTSCLMMKMQNLVIGRKKIPRWLYFSRLAVFFFASFLIMVYLAFAPMVNRDFYNIRVLFKPVKCDKFSKVWFGRQAKEVSFRNRTGKLLHGLFLPSNVATRCILIHHGQYGNINNHLRACGFLLRPENSVFIYDYAGFGKNEGSPTIRGLADDSRTAYDFLVNNLHVEPNKVVHFGGSLGSGPAALVAAENPCAGLLLFSPYTSIKNDARDVFPFLKIYPDFLLTDYDFDTIANVSRLKVPVLIVHGTDDASIPITHGDQIFAAAHNPKTYLRVQSGGHFVTDSDEVQTKVLRFIDDLSIGI